jgi:hypothetical protein
MQGGRGNAMASTTITTTNPVNLVATTLSGATSLAEKDRLTALIAEADDELALVVPAIETLEQQLNSLSEMLGQLKQKQQRLLALKAGLAPLVLGVIPKAITESLSPAKPNRKADTPLLPINSAGVFLPELAFEQVTTLLKRTDSINYALFKAVVYAGGTATTQQMRAFLAEQGTIVPKTGESFSQVPLSAISARAAYLVRRGVLRLVGSGCYMSCLGWDV